MLAVAEAYGRKRGFVLREELGWGIHGSVWKVSSQAASAEWVVKIHRHRPPWQREADCYGRLKELEVTEVQGLNVPILIHADQD